jgi:lipoprotein NlpD
MRATRNCASPRCRGADAALLTLLMVTALTLCLSSCGGGLAPVDNLRYGPTPPGHYRVRNGDTLSEIAERKRVRMSSLVGWNGLSDPNQIYVGQLLRVEPPEGASKARRSAGGNAGRSPTRTASAQPVKTVTARSRPPGSLAAASGINWQWPVQGKVEQGFSPGDRTRQGIRISAREGTPVRAAAAGSVVYSGSGLKGYGNLIIVKHNGRYLSAYAFNRRLLAREGDRVARGQTLAESGHAPNGRNLLHFEIRRDGSAVDPLQYLPRSL